MVPTIENYSIDESFLNLGEFREREVEPLARELRERVQRWVGISTCVGIAPTKTLAKVANFIAKKRPQYRGVCDLRSSQVRADLLATVPGDEVLGIGAASAAKLLKIGVQTAADLAALEPDNARALMTVTGGRTVYELRGISCLPLELMEPTRKGIAVTRSFGAPLMSWREMREAIASYATRAAEKMRRYKVAAENIIVFMHTSTFNNDPFYSNGASGRFSETTNDTGEVVALAVRLGERLWRDGFRYSKCGVMITELMPETIRQPALWGDLDHEKRERAWKAMDKLNATLGRDTVRILGAGPEDAVWKLRAEHRSPRWTTRWDELPKVRSRYDMRVCTKVRTPRIPVNAGKIKVCSDLSLDLRFSPNFYNLKGSDADGDDSGLECSRTAASHRFRNSDEHGALSLPSLSERPSVAFCNFAREKSYLDRVPELPSSFA
jgi:DNA polymerase V